MFDIVQENSGQKRCKHIIGEDDTSNSKDYLVMETQNVKGTSLQAGEVTKGSKDERCLRNSPLKSSSTRWGLAF